MSIIETWFDSIREGNIREVIGILKNNPDIINQYTTINDGKHKYSTNAIIEASYQGNREIVKWLIDNKADVNSLFEGGWRPIHFAAQHGHVTTVNWLVHGGADVNAETDKKETPIYLALQSYMRDTVKRLLHHGASLEGIDPNFLHSCIQKDILSYTNLSQENKACINNVHFKKSDINGYELGTRHFEKEYEEVKINKIHKSVMYRDYDHDLKQRRLDLYKKLRRNNEPANILVSLVRKIGYSELDNERIDFSKEAINLIVSEKVVVPQCKLMDQMINYLELTVCDSFISSECLSIISSLMCHMFHRNNRRGDNAIIDFCCKIFDKMNNLQIEQYTNQILQLLISIFRDNMNETSINCLKGNKDAFMKSWCLFFENLGFANSIEYSLDLLKLISEIIPEIVNENFHDVIDILIGWFISHDTNYALIVKLRKCSAKLRICWLGNMTNIRQIITNLLKDITSKCNNLSRIHRFEKDRSQIEELKHRIKHFTLGLTCVTAGISGMASYSHSYVDQLHNLSDTFILETIQKLIDNILICSKQIDFDIVLVEINTVLINLIYMFNNDKTRQSGLHIIWRYVLSTLLPLHSRTPSDTNVNIYNIHLFDSYLTLIDLLCKQMNSIDHNMLVQIFSPIHPIHSLMFYASNFNDKITNKVLAIIKAVLTEHTSTVLYQIFLSDLELGFNSLIKLNCDNFNNQFVHLVQNNAFRTKIYTDNHAQRVIRYNLSLIYYMHNLTDVGLKLSPNMPTLISKYLIICTYSYFIKQYTQLALFIYNLFNKLNKSHLDCIKFTIEFQQSFLQCSKQLDLVVVKEKFCQLTGVYNKHITQLDNDKKLKLNIIHSLLILLTDLPENDVEFINTVYDFIIYLISTIVVTNLTLDFKPILIKLIMKNCTNADDKIRKKCFVLYFELSLYKDILLNFDDYFVEEFENIQLMMHDGRNFKFPQDVSSNLFNWLIGYTDKTESYQTRLTDCLSTINSNDNRGFRNYLLMTYEVIMNSCWDCVKQKLKFDPSVDSRMTLCTIEYIIKFFLTNGLSSRNNNDKRFRNMMSIFLDKSTNDQAQTVSILILFVDNLEKMFYNCYAGCVGLAKVGKTTEMFFVKNRHVCTEWFAKMRMAIMALAQYSGQWSTVIRQGLQLLETNNIDVEAGGLKQEIEDCIVLTSMSLSKMRNWEMLIGLHEWAVKRYGHKFNWLKCLADKTKGSIELALEGYERYISENHDPIKKSKSELKLLTRQSYNQSSFILVMDEIAECNLLLADHKKLDEWNKTIQDWKENPQIPEAQKSTINWTRLSCLAKLSKWDQNELDKSIESKEDICVKCLHTDVTWKYKSIIDNCEDQLYLSAVNGNGDSIESIRNQLCQMASLQNLSDYPSSFINPDLVLINEKLNYLQANLNNECLGSSNLEELSKLSVNLPLSLIGYHNVVNKFRAHQSTSDFNSRKFLIKWHRTHRNFNQSEQMIDESFKVFLKQNTNQSLSLSNSKSPEIQMNLNRELSKIHWAKDNKNKALTLLITNLIDGLFYETGDNIIHFNKCKYNTKSLLTLFKWLNMEKSNFKQFCDDSTISNKLQMLIELAEVPWIQGLPIVSPQHRTSDKKQCNLSVTDVCGQLLILASKSKNQDTSDKSFISLAQWCLVRSNAVDEAGFNISNTSTVIDNKLRNILGDNCEEETLKLMLKTFTNLFKSSKMETEDDWLGIPFDDSEFLEVVKITLLSNGLVVSDTEMTNVIELWIWCVENHFSLHNAAADAYFSFLRENSNVPVHSDNLSTKNKTMANLRILALLGKRCRKLRTSIIAKIKTSPPISWETVIPQLFARLKHPDVQIRKCMVDLLQRLAICRSTPTKTVIYPTLVGLLNIDKSIILPYQEIKHTISDRNQAMVDEVTVFIEELCRITVLWDELWISSLGQCYDELQKKSSFLQSEIDKIDSSDDDKERQNKLMELKYESVIQPGLFILERVKLLTDKHPETPRESWFIKCFSEDINKVINALKFPADIRAFKKIWRQVHELQEFIITETNNKNKIKSKNGRQQVLKLTEVSPGLTKLMSNKIPLPGDDNKSNLIKIHEDIYIYPTKTKPKKLRFVASNGKTYSYLYKGLEDLRLDERIMQILGMFNTMFGKINTKESNKYNITTYSVTPMGPKSGLIKMVDNATSMFSLYKRYHSKSKVNVDLNKARSKILSNNEGMPEELQHVRPADIFWQKLRPKLESVSKLDIINESRDKWPVNILCEVLNELREETPKDLLSKELWCSSINPNNWFNSSNNFIRSCAVMSIVGNMIGLGDRHLDNLLVNLSTGSMVHIDYNVCFDKGVTLKVPEKVPFRLTDIMLDVFGPMSVEGIFKTTCCNVVEIIQQSRDNILTLMDTFIFDPIVDWSTGVESGLFGSYEGGRYAIGNNKSIFDKRAVEFIISFNNFKFSLMTYNKDFFISKDQLIECCTLLGQHFEIHLDKLSSIDKISEHQDKNRLLLDFLSQTNVEQQNSILENHIEMTKAQEESIEVINEINVKQTYFQSVVTKQSAFFNQLLKDSHFIIFCLDIINIHTFIKDQLNNFCNAIVDKNEYYNRIVEKFVTFCDELKVIQDDLVIVKRYHNVIQEMPESYFVSSRFNHLLRVISTDLMVDKENGNNITTIIDEYNSNWRKIDTEMNDANQLYVQKVWLNLTEQLVMVKQQVQVKLVDQPNQEEGLAELGNIWRIIYYENIVGINMFKAVLLEQYLELMNYSTQLDKLGTVSKVPDIIGFDYDYNSIARNYLLLLNIHDNYFRLLTNYFGSIQVGFTTPESTTISNMMICLHKVCSSIVTMESNFIEIIMPESIKIIKQIKHQDEENLFIKLLKIKEDSQSILTYFNHTISGDNIQFDSNNYDIIHSQVIVPMKEDISNLCDLSKNEKENETNYTQLRILIASFLNTIIKTYNSICELLDFCVTMSTPSSWNFIDVVSQSSINISNIWTRSIKLLKDTVFVSAINCMINSLISCRDYLSQFKTQKSQSNEIYPTSTEFHDVMLRPIAHYYGFINQHILVGIGSQCFSKMFCVLLESCGWNIDSIVNDANNTILNSEYLCNTVVNYRKSEYQNAFTFYTQLEYCFDEYKKKVGFRNKIEENDIISTNKFVVKNMTFVNALLKLARNQLITTCWQNKRLLQCEDVGNEKVRNPEIEELKSLEKLISTLPERLIQRNNLLSLLSGIDIELDEYLTTLNVPNNEQNYQNLINIKSKLMSCIKVRVGNISDALENIESFESMRNICTNYNDNNKIYEFDNGILKFFNKITNLHSKLQHHDEINPMEIEIINLKETYLLDNNNWWTKLCEILTNEIDKYSTELHQHQQIIDDIVSDHYFNDKHNFTKTLSDELYGLIGHVKSSLKPIQSCYKKIHKLIQSDDTLLKPNSDFKVKVDLISNMLNLLDKINLSVDNSVKFLTIFEQSNQQLETIKHELPQQINGVNLLKDVLIPEFYGYCQLLTSSNSVNLTCKYPDSDELSLLGSGVGVKFGFSNNNMAESNNGATTDASGLLRVTSSSDEELTNSATKNIKHSDLTSHRESSVIRSVEEIDTKPKFELIVDIKSLNNNNNGNVDRNISTNTAVNNSGIQRAIESWKLVESRINLSTNKQHNTAELDHELLVNPGFNKQQNAEFVNKLIKMARSDENLAQMFEGWTAWV